MSDLIANQVLLDSLSHGVLLFSSDNKLVQYNAMAGTLLGADLNTIRADGWLSATQLFETDPRNPDDSLENVRKNALTAQRPIHFYVYRSGEYVPCWMSAVVGNDGSVYTMMTLDTADWHAVAHVINRFRQEMREAITSTVGHINLINRTLNITAEDDSATAKVAKRIGGFTKLIAIHMQRAERLSQMTERLEDIRTGRVRAVFNEQRHRIKLDDFLEDFLETLDNTAFLDPETEIQDLRARIISNFSSGIAVTGVRRYLMYVLQELLRNAMMYSMRGTPVTLTTSIKGNMAQVDVSDEGYGIRERDFERVFQAFERGRQPQVISEFGYGLGLHLCKHEISAMNGKLWFTTNENIGTTFSLQLPLWQESSSSQSHP